MFKRFFLYSFVVCVASAAVARGLLPTKPKELAHKEGCYIQEINDVIPFGEEAYPIGHCYRVECSRSSISYASCGVAYTNDPKCHKTETDLRKPYPQCCPDIKCDVENNVI